MNPEAQNSLTDAIEAKQNGDWERALTLLRQCAKYIAPASLSYLRGGIWYDAGYPEVAVLFSEHATVLDPNNTKYQIVFLDALESADRTRAQKEATRIVKEYERRPAIVVIRASEVVYFAAQTKDELDARKAFQELITVVTRVLGNVSESDQKEFALMGWSLLAFCYRNLGEINTAVECYSRGLRINPSNEGLLTGRGILTYGKSSQSTHDFEQAVQLGTQLVWPYYFLSHNYLMHGRFEDCWRLCERGLQNPITSSAVRSHLLEWSAIAQAELKFPQTIVRAAFEQAIRLDPANSHARQNLERFENTFSRSVPEDWDKRSESSVRAFGQAEWQASTCVLVS
jgi:tetratricopeptide (TPR) repeat protein